MKGSTIVSVVIISIVAVTCLFIVYTKHPPSAVERNVQNTGPTSASNTPAKSAIQHKDAGYYISKPDVENQLAIFTKQADKRKDRNLHSNRLANLQYSFTPQILCPTMVRAGSPTDGGKWVCNPWLVPLDCVIMSLGVSGDSSFEQELQTFVPTPCKVYGFDSSAGFAGTYKKVNNGKFFNYKIQAETNKLKKEYSIQDIADQLSVKRIDVFKIDIESSEFAAVPTLFEQKGDELVLKIPICQLLVEVHPQGKTAGWITLLQTIEKAGFLLFQREANTHCQPACYEYAWIHKDCLADYHVNLPVIFNNF